MLQYQSLSADKLRRTCNPNVFSFQDTSEVPPSRDLIGQQRAVDAMEFGLHIKLDGYNIYMAGESGEGKTRHALDMAQKHAKNRKVPDDWCYVYNFEDVNQPKAIHLPAGKGREFKKDMEDFVKILEQEIIKAFEGDDYEEERAKIIKQFKEKKDELVEILNQGALEHGFKVKISNSGLYFLPVINGEPISEEDFKALTDEQRQEINTRSEVLQQEAFEIIRKMKELELEAEEAIREWENQIALFAVGIHIENIKERYRNYPDIEHYLENVQDDILNHLESFREEEPSE